MPPNHFSVYGHGPNKQGIHAMQALYAEDQLRQRVAFALSQIFVIASEDVGLIGSSTEVYAQYFDIFVRQTAWASDMASESRETSPGVLGK